MKLTIGELKQKQVELTKRLNLFTRQNNFLMIMEVKQQLKKVEDAISDYDRVDNLGLDNINNKHLKSWFGKSISLSINCNDLSDGNRKLDSIEWQHEVEKFGCRYLVVKTFDGFREAVNDYLSEGIKF